MRSEKVLSVIHTLRRGWYVPNVSLFKMDEFQRASYRMSALEELEDYFRSNLRAPFREDPWEILENFRKQCENASCENKTEDYKFMFTIYYDVVTDVMDQLSK